MTDYYLPQTHTKTKESRRVLINPVVGKILKEKWLESGRKESGFVFPRAFKYDLLGKIRRSFKEVRKIAGIDGLRFHDLRHTAGTRLGESGVPLQTIAKLLGHATTRMTERYVYSEESVREATEILANFSKRVTDKTTDIDEEK